MAVGHRFIAEGGSYVEGTVFRDWRKQRTKERGARDAALRGPHVKESGLTFYEESDKTRPDQDFFPQATIVTFFDNKEYNKMIGICPYSKEIQAYADHQAILKAAPKQYNHYERNKSEPVHESKVHRWCNGVPI